MLGAYELGLFHSEKAHHMSHQLDVPQLNTIADEAHAEQLRLAGNIDEALPIIEKALDMSEKMGDAYSQDFTVLIAGQIYMDAGREDDAIRLFKQAIHLYRKTERKTEIALLLAAMAHISLNRQDREQTMSSIEQIIKLLSEMSEQAESPTITSLCWTCYHILEQYGDPRAAEFLKNGYDLVLKAASAITEPELYHTFVNNIEENKQLISAWNRRNDRNDKEDTDA